MRISFAAGLMLGAAAVASADAPQNAAPHTYFCVAKGSPMDPNTYTSAQFTSTEGQMATQRAFEEFLSEHYGRSHLGGGTMCYPSAAVFRQGQTKAPKVVDTGWSPGAH